MEWCINISQHFNRAFGYQPVEISATKFEVRCEVDNISKIARAEIKGFGATATAREIADMLCPLYLLPFCHLIFIYQGGSDNGRAHKVPTPRFVVLISKQDINIA